MIPVHQNYRIWGDLRTHNSKYLKFDHPKTDWNSRMACQDFQLALKQAFESFLNKEGDHVANRSCAGIGKMKVTKMLKTKAIAFGCFLFPASRAAGSSFYFGRKDSQGLFLHSSKTKLWISWYQHGKDPRFCQTGWTKTEISVPFAFPRLLGHAYRAVSLALCWRSVIHSGPEWKSCKQLITIFLDFSVDHVDGNTICSSNLLKVVLTFFFFFLTRFRKGLRGMSNDADVDAALEQAWGLPGKMRIYGQSKNLVGCYNSWEFYCLYFLGFENIVVQKKESLGACKFKLRVQKDVHEYHIS